MKRSRDSTGYIDELRKDKNGEMLFTLTQFDSIAVDIIHDAEPLEKGSQTQ
jgi:hypothetical protein